MKTETTRRGRRPLAGIAFALIVGALLAFVLSSGSSLIERGQPAPPFELVAADSERPVSLEGLRGKVVLLDFWSTSCPPCMTQLRDLERLQGQMRGEDLVILGINAEGAPRESVRDFARTHRVQYTLLADPGQVARAYRVVRLPTLYIVDRDGHVRWSREGYTPSEELSRIVDELL
jgi:peroxiredoxin